MIKGIGIAKLGDSGGNGDVSQWTEEQIYYVGKHGSNTNDGKSINKAVLTITQAIVLVNLQTPSSTNRFRIEICDAGTYEETFTIPTYVSIIGFTAKIIPSSGHITMNDESYLIVHTIEVLSVTGAVVIAGMGISYIHALGSFINDTAGAFAITFTGKNTLYLTVNRIQSIPSAGKSYFLWSDLGSSVYIDIDYLQSSGDSYAFIIKDTTGLLLGRIKEVSSSSQKPLITVSENSTINLTSNKIISDNFLHISETAQIIINCPDITGTITNNGIDGHSLEIYPQKGFELFCSDQEFDLELGTVLTFPMPYDMQLLSVKANVITAPVGADIIVDILDDTSTSILSTLISIDDGEKSSEDSATPPVILTSAMGNDKQFSISITQKGSSTAGIGLVVTLIGY